MDSHSAVTWLHWDSPRKSRSFNVIHCKCASFRWPGPLSLLSCASWSTSSTAFCDGVLSRTVPWELLKKQFYENKAYQNFYEYLRDEERTKNSNRLVVDPVRDMMRLLMDEFTSLEKYARPPQSNIANSLFIVCTNDGYILRDGIPHMDDVWPGCLVRYIPYGHISAFVFNQSLFYHAVAEMLQRQQPNIKLKKNPLVSPVTMRTSTHQWTSLYKALPSSSSFSLTGKTANSQVFLTLFACARAILFNDNSAECLML